MKSSAIKHSLALFCLALACGGAHAELADRNKPVHLESDQGSVDDAKQVSTFEGRVVLTQGTMIIHSDKLVVVENKEGYYHGTATGLPASFRQKREGLDEYIDGYGERIEYDTQNETVDFYGHARMIKSQDEVRGDHITYNSRTEIFQVHGAPAQQGGSGRKGRVQVILQPKSRTPEPPGAPLPITPAENISPKE